MSRNEKFDEGAFSFRHRVHTDPDGAVTHVISAHLPGHGDVGEMTLRGSSAGRDRPKGHIEDLQVDYTLHRRGIATALWKHAHQLADQGIVPRPKHSRARTPEGDEWARSVGGKLPPRPRNWEG